MGRAARNEARWMYGSSREFAELLALARLGLLGQHQAPFTWRSYRFCLMFRLSWLGRPWRIDPALVCPGALDAAAWGSATRRLT